MTYAPVAVHKLTMTGDRLTGYAAPASGTAPCLLRLTADDRVIAMARATRFSANARAAGIRLGWCGVGIPGLAVAAALGSDLKVHCVASDRLIWRRHARAPIAPPAVRTSPLTVFDIIALSRAEDVSPDLSEIRPFMQRHLLDHGIANFIDATFKTFLGRPAEAEVIQAWSGDAGKTPMDEIVARTTSSAEYRGNRLRTIPGPFNAAFRYDLAALD